jgi:hypothetical protein
LISENQPTRTVALFSSRFSGSILISSSGSILVSGHTGVKQLVINLDNGPECNGHRSQFLLRMTEFADMTGLRIRLVYYPPYHSKYNGIERYWAGLERSWNGYLLSTVETVLNRAGHFFWKGMRTVVQLLDTPYEKGVKVCGNEKLKIEQRLQRSHVLHWWDITIYPKLVWL